MSTGKSVAAVAATVVGLGIECSDDDGFDGMTLPGCC